MKLSNKYRNEIAKYKLPNNLIFKYLGDKIVDTVFATVPDVDEMNVMFTNDEIEYLPNEQETDFFEKQYIVLDKTNETVCIDKRLTIPNELIEKIGTMEYKILDFVYNGGHRLLLTGKKGWGKTTFLRYVCRYLIPKLNICKDVDNKFYNKPCQPIYISFNSHINSLNFANKNEYSILLNKIILDKIRSCRYDYLYSDMRSGFYQYLLDKDEFLDDKSEYDNIIHRHKKAWITSDERDQILDELRMKISKKPETILYSFAYCNDNNKCPAIPLIIFDDLDPLHTSVQTYIFTEIYKLAHMYKIKIIVSMRPRSYKIVTKAVAEAIQINNEIPFSDCFEDSYLEGKFKKIYTHINENNPQKEGIEIGNNLILKPLNIELFFKNFSNISLNREVLSFLKNVSGGNLRKLNEFIKVYLKSGYIDINSNIFNNLIEKYISPDSSSNMPLWIVYSAIFTNNYETIFGVSNEPDKYVVNILCNGTSSSNTYLIRLHLLSFFCRNGRTPCSFSNIVDKYKKLIINYSDEVHKNDIARAIKRLNNYNLIANNTILEIPDAENTDRLFEQIDNSNEFYLEELGRYYYESMISIFEYFYFMKDDINFRNGTEILSCVDTKTNIILRFEQVIKYFELFFEEERRFYQELSPDGKKCYLNNFAPFYGDEKIFYIQVFVENMLNYAKTRKYINIQDIIDKLNELNETINETTRSIQL